MKLYEISAEHKAALDLLADMEDLDQQTIDDSMAAINDELESKVLNCAKYLKEMDAEAKAIKDVEAGLAARRKALEGKVSRFKEYIRINMVATGMSKAKDAAISVSLTKARESVHITDEAAIPEEYIKTVRSPMKTELGKALKDGDDIPGATLATGEPGLTIR